MDRRTFERDRKRFYRDNLLRDLENSSSDDELIEMPPAVPDLQAQGQRDQSPVSQQGEAMQVEEEPYGFQEVIGVVNAENGIEQEPAEIESDDAWDFDGDNEAEDSDLGCPNSGTEESSNDSSDDDDANYMNEANTPLFEGSQLTLIQSFVALLAVFFRCNLSIQAFKIILDTIALHLPERNNFFSSLNYFNKFLPNNRLFVKKNRYCKSCYIVDGFGDCTCETSKSGHFLTFSIKQQLDILFQRESFRNLLGHRFERRKKCEANIEDIYDGEIYKSFVDNGFLSDRNNISFLWYTDGVPLYKSSKYSVWPLFFIINELPYSVRYLPENVIFGGLWYGNTKPYFNSYFLPLYEELNLLQTRGVILSARDTRGDHITVKAKILCGCCDLPARALVLNMNQYNGLYSCHKCLIRGKRFFYTQTSSVFVFPNSIDGEAISLRNLRDTKLHVNEAVRTEKTVFGFKGPTLLSKFVPNILTCTSIDSMHAIFSGVVKRMVTLLLSNTFAAYDFSLNRVAKLVDERIKLIKPPNFVKRLPRDFGTHLSYLKSAEFKVWFFYFSIPIFLDIMPEPYLSHYISLVEACMLLSGDSISNADIDRAEHMLKDYVMHYEEYYGLRFMTANVHMLLHLADTVRQLGPLWVTSCFPLEDLNGKLTRLVHGTRGAEHQIWKSFLALQKLPKHQSNVRENPALSAFLDSLKNNMKCNITKEIDRSMFVVGKLKFLNFIPDKFNQAFYRIGVDLKKVWLFLRLKKGSLLYTSLLYKNNSLRTFSSCASYLDLNREEKIGMIYCFLQIKECICIEENVCGCEATYFAVMKTCDVRAVENCSFINDVVSVHGYEAVNIKNLSCINYLVVVNDKKFSIKPVKAFEFE